MSVSTQKSTTIVSRREQYQQEQVHRQTKRAIKSTRANARLARSMKAYRYTDEEGK